MLVRVRGLFFHIRLAEPEQIEGNIYDAIIFVAAEQHKARVAVRKPGGFACSADIASALASQDYLSFLGLS